MIHRIRFAAVAAACVCLFALAAQAAGGLKPGEYACYGSGGTALMGLGFKILDASHYNDLDGKSPGTYAVNGNTVAFHGGHLSGYSGVNLKNNKFELSGHMIGCEPA